jgi:hypothetical protein
MAKQQLKAIWNWESTPDYEQRMLLAFEMLIGEEIALEVDSRVK